MPYYTPNAVFGVDTSGKDIYLPVWSGLADILVWTIFAGGDPTPPTSPGYFVVQGALPERNPISEVTYFNFVRDPVTAMYKITVNLAGQCNRLTIVGAEFTDPMASYQNCYAAINLRTAT